MPIYEYICKNGHRTEEIYLLRADAPVEDVCPVCHGDNVKIVSASTFKLGWEMVVNDSGRVWDGTPLEGTDGVNELYYKSKRLQFDMAGKAETNGASNP